MLMKAKLTKLFTLLAVLLFGFGQMWAEVKLVSVGTEAVSTIAGVGTAPDFFSDKTYKSGDESYSVTISTTFATALGSEYKPDGSTKYKDYYYNVNSACDMSTTPSNYIKVSTSNCKITKIVIRGLCASSTIQPLPALGCVDGLPTTSTIGSNAGRFVDVIIDNQSCSYGDKKRFDQGSEATYTFTTNVSEVYFSKQFKKVALTGAAAWSTVPSSSQTYCVYGMDVYVEPTAVATAPAITAPTTDQSATYTIGDAITALEVTATGSPAPTYQWYYNSSASTEGATSLGSGAQTASYTPDNSVASDLYYYCVATNSAGSATSPYFHVTVNTPSTPTHDITYTNTKGADNSSNPTEFYEGVGVASFEPLTDVANFHFTGWSPASIADDATTDQTIDAQWVASYNVTFSAGEGTGAVPDAFQKWEGATFNLPEKGSLTHATKVFDGWKANGTGGKIAAGAEYTMTAAAVEFVAQWKAAPTVLFHYQWTGSGTQPSVDDVLNGTGGTITVERKEGSTKTLSNESATFKSTVPADMRFTGSTSKGIKFGTSDVYFHIALTSGKFEEGDTIRICGYESFLVSSTSTSSAGTGDISSGFATGANNSNYDTASCVIPAIIPSDLYVRRTSSSAGFAAIKVIRPVKYAVNFAAGEGTGTMTAKAYPAGAEVTLPECTFTAPASKEFDAWTSSDVTISAGKFTMPANDVTITATWKAETPKYDITYYPGTGGSGSIDPAKKTKDVDFVLSSERFTRAGYLQTGWATADGGVKVYELGATYTENADLELYPFWTELDTYVASFACGSTPAGWTYSNDGFDTDSKATVASVCTFVDNGLGTPKTTTGDGTEDDNVAFAKNADAIATYDLGITTTVAALNVVLNGGSSSAFNETIEYLGADGSTVKQSYTNSLSAGNWKDNTISKTDVVADVRYIRVHGASKWVVMKSFSVSYIETRTKYDVAFAAGTGASGTMPTLHYAEGAEVVLPAATFTPPTDKEFDAWTSSDVTITDGKFTMPASDVTVTATWKDAITRYDVTFETNGGSTIDAQEVEENGHPTAVADPTKANYVFVGWFNNSDLAPEHAVADITALTITDDITLYAKWQLDIRLRQLVFSNGFDAFIKNNEVKAYYMEGTSVPTMVSYQGVNLKDVADAVTIVGNKVRMVGTDDSVIELDLILEAVTPMSSYDKQIFDGTETYVKTGNEFSTTSGKLGWKFSKNDGDWSRETPGQNRIYFFVGGSADRATFTSGASSRAIKVYVNNELVSSVETTAAAGSTFDIPLPAANAYNMIAIISNQTSGDGSVTDIQLNEHVISTDVSLSSLTVNGNAVTLVPGQYTYTYELPYGTVDAPTVIAVANAAPYATVSAITVDGTTKATFTVTAESSATQDYVVNFTIARFPTIALWDGSTMTAVVANGDPSLNGITWASTGVSVTSFSAKTCDDNGKSYTKALDFGGNTKATRQFSITIPDGNVARISLVCNAKGTGARSISVGTDLAGVIDENAVSSIETADNTNLFAVAFDFFAAGTLFINTTDGFQVHEITIQMAPGYGRSAMLGNGVLGTVCVPNNVAVEDIQGATFYELAGREPEHGKLAFDEITSGELEAGVPYLFQAQGNHIALLYGATSVGAPVDKGNGMYGTFSDITLTELDDVYYFAQKALWGCSDLTSLSVPANRAYVKLSEIDYLSDPNPAPGRRRILMGVNGENQATGFENIESGDAPMKVMIDGTLYILRGEKVFDATGRLVK